MACLNKHTRFSLTFNLFVILFCWGLSAAATAEEFCQSPLSNERLKQIFSQNALRQVSLEFGDEYLEIGHVQIVDIAPDLWYRFCGWQGWLASHPTRGASSGEEKERITNPTRIIWAGASNHALKADCRVALGHTHTSGRREHGISAEAGFQTYMLVNGNLPDGTCAEITNDAQLRFLP